MAQAQDTGRAPGTTDDAVPVDDLGDVFDKLTSTKPEIVEGPTGAAAEGQGIPSGANGATGAAAPPAAGLPDPAHVNADGSPKGPAGATGAAEPVAGATGAPAAATGATGAAEPPAGATGAAPPSDFGREFLDQMRSILEPKKEDAPAPPAVTPWTAEQSALVAKTREEYPEVMQAFDLEVKKAAQTIVAHMFAQLGPRIGALEGQVTEASNQSHDQQVMSAIPDMAELTPKLMGWIATLPPVLKQTYSQVAEQGSVADIVQMVDHYRVASNTPKPAAAAAPPPPANANANAAAAAAAATAAAEEARRRTIAASAAPVGGKASGQAVDTIDRNNFDDAFDKFAEHAKVA